MKYRVTVCEEIEAVQVFEIDAESPEDAALKADLLRETERRCDIVSSRSFNVMEAEKSQIFKGYKAMGHKLLAVYDDSDLEDMQ